MKRVFLIVLDSVGIGEMPDAADYGDAGSNTIRAVASSPYFSMPNMRKLGFFNIDGVEIGEKEKNPAGSFARMTEVSKGKDTTIGHWEIAGIISNSPLPTYPNGFPQEILDEFTKRTGRGVLCNKPYSGTDVIRDYGKEHMETGALIVYTSADSVFQIAAHEEVVPIETLYEYCKIAREMLTGDLGVGRVIARPFIGTWPNYERTIRRHDFSLAPPRQTVLDALNAEGKDVIGVGKIYDIFEGQGVTETYPNQGNEKNMEKTIEIQKKEFDGLCYVNLVDGDMIYGHRRDIAGYAGALTQFDEQLGEFLANMRDDDMLMITADHGCDPGYTGTDHTREYVPCLIYGKEIKAGVNLHTRKGFADMAATIAEALGSTYRGDGESFWGEIRNKR